MVSTAEIKTSIDELELAGKSVCIHASLRSFGEIQGKMLLDEFIAKGCTVLVPTFSHEFEQPPPKGHPLTQNGMTAEDVAQLVAHKTNDLYHPDCNNISGSMGTFPRILLEQPDRSRGNNPLNSFAALGVAADTLVAGQTAQQLYAPFEKLCAQQGFVLLMGVGLERATILHYAEQLAGRKLFIRWALDAQGRTIPVQVGGCSRGFGCFAEQVRPIRRVVQVGGSLWQCFPAQELVRLCANIIRTHPDITRCADVNCVRCGNALEEKTRESS